LEGVINKETVVPYRRYRAEMAHKKGKGIDTGGFPVSVAKEVLRLLKSAQKNALEKELSEENLYVISASARKGPSRYHYGRYSGRKMKSTNVEIVVGERDKK
jgi:large subunit ribosomal protein L22